MSTPSGAERPPDDDLYPPDEGPLRRLGRQTMSLTAFGCAALALLFCPLLFGPAGILFGWLGHHRGESLGKWAALTSVLALVGGTVLGLLYYHSELRDGGTGVGFRV
ncbi:hypothetical protein D5S18_08285 [Nocardia panacis]|uniref:DUF4190 domain-containing protein n=1 Tax=Nocardia panacis TaxID=2340916 RepID=A0A3A4KS17_9NOCA|nr:hypothetical protein [Nocardia panacis]RJO76336.1 hypothetical protein D5S18_08285 [Nocardia panacis]